MKTMDKITIKNENELIYISELNETEKEIQKEDQVEWLKEKILLTIEKILIRITK